jgi:hypothetical protein
MTMLSCAFIAGRTAAAILTLYRYTSIDATFHRRQRRRGRRGRVPCNVEAAGDGNRERPPQYLVIKVKFFCLFWNKSSQLSYFKSYRTVLYGMYRLCHKVTTK